MFTYGMPFSHPQKPQPMFDRIPLDFTTLNARLKSGATIILDNEEHQLAIGDDDIREAELSLSDDNTFAGYKLWFNGVLLASPKTFRAYKNRLVKLIEKWNLKEIVVVK